MEAVGFSEQPNSSIPKLLEYQKTGHLFHGSPNSLIEVLTPRKSNETDPNRKFNSDTAVFASNLALASVIFGVVPERDRLPREVSKLPWAVNWPEGKVTARIPISWKPYVKSNKGFVYVLPKETFKENLGSQYKSKHPVIPIEKIEVTLDNFLEMGGIVEWVE